MTILAYVSDASNHGKVKGFRPDATFGNFERMVSYLRANDPNQLLISDVPLSAEQASSIASLNVKRIIIAEHDHSGAEWWQALYEEADDIINRKPAMSRAEVGAMLSHPLNEAFLNGWRYERRQRSNPREVAQERYRAAYRGEKAQVYP